MNQSKLFFGGTRLEQAHNADDSYVFGIRKYGSGMGTIKLSIRVLPGFVFLK